MGLSFPYATTIYDEDATLRIAMREAERCIRVVEKSRQDVVLGWTTALRLQGIPVPRNELSDDFIYVCVDRRRGHRSCLDGVVYKYWSGPTETIDLLVGDAILRVMSPLTACLQMLSVMGLENAVVLLSSLFRRKNPDRERLYQDLENIVAKVRSFHGVTMLRRVFPLVHRNGDSPAETRVSYELIMRGIGGSNGKWLANCRVVCLSEDYGHHVDFCDPELGIILEYQGALHWSKPQGERDSEKSLLFQYAGCVVVAITAKNMASREARDEFFLTLENLVESRRRMRREGKLDIRAQFFPL